MKVSLVSKAQVACTYLWFARDVLVAKSGAPLCGRTGFIVAVPPSNRVALERTDYYKFAMISGP